jgi:hypothetical protein
LELIVGEKEVSKVYSTFLCGSKEVKQIEFASNLQEAEVRKYLETQANKTTKSKIQIPRDNNEVITHLENFQGLSKFIFGPTSQIVKSIEPWLKFCKGNKLSLQQQAFDDHAIFAKILTIIDKRVQAFLRSCRDANDSDEINYKYLDFAKHLAVFEEEEISPTPLQPAIAALIRAMKNTNQNKKSEWVSNSNQNQSKKDDWVLKSPPPKRMKGGAVSSQAKNEHLSQDFKARYARNFTKMWHVSGDLPEWEGVPICARFHCSGFCKDGTDCARAATHKKLPSSQMKELAAWFEATAGPIPKN